MTKLKQTDAILSFFSSMSSPLRQTRNQVAIENIELTTSGRFKVDQSL
jgi:hypothetical protein